MRDVIMSKWLHFTGYNHCALRQEYFSIKVNPGSSNFTPKIRFNKSIGFLQVCFGHIIQTTLSLSKNKSFESCFA